VPGEVRNGLCAVARGTKSACLPLCPAENVGMSVEEFRDHSDDDYLRW
jgi:hypothetical protein